MKCLQKKLLAVAVMEAYRTICFAPVGQRAHGRWMKSGLALGIALGYSVGHAADAVSAASAPSGASSASDAPAPRVTQLDTVTVTADKRVERAIDVPVSVATVSGKAMLQEHKSTLTDYLNGTPGVLVNGNATKNIITVRGLSTGGVSNPTVAVLVDDVPINASTSSAEGGSVVPNLDPSLIQNIQVLRGPQGTLYGAASLGGLVKYTTIDPNVTTLSGQAQVDGNGVAHGGAGDAERVSINVPLVQDTAAVDISAFNRWDPGYYRNANDGTTGNGSARTQGGRIGAIFYLGDKVTVRSSLLFQNTKVDGLDEEYWGANMQPLYGAYANSVIPGSSYSSTDYMLFSTAVTADLGWGLLTSTTGFSNARYGTGLDMTPTFGQIATLVGLNGYGAILNQTDQTEKFSEELRLESPHDGRKLEWRVGAFFTNEVSDVNQVINFANVTTGQLLPGGRITSEDVDSRYREVAGFASATYHFTDRFDTQVGFRYSRNDQRYYETGASQFDGTSNDGSFSYMLAPSYHLTQDWMVYGRVANGYRPGGANAVSTAGLPRTYGPDKAVNFELGTKSEFWDKRVAVDLSVYHIKWTDIQLQAVDPVTSLGYTVNSGGAKSDGVEAAISAKPWRGMTVTAALGYSHAVLTTNTPDSIYGQTGDPLPGSARWTATLGLLQTYSLPAGMRGFASGTLTFLGDRVQDFTPSAKTPRLDAPAYATVDLSTGASKDDWTVVAYIRNLFDRRGINSLSYMDQISYSPIYGANLIPPRTIGVSVTKAF